MTAKTWALLALCLLPAMASGSDTMTIGAWEVGFTDDRTTVYAGTMNDSGSVLAETCATDKDSCFWILTTDSACEEGAEYPVLVNSDQSAVSAVVTCLGPADSKRDHRYRFNDWKSLEAVILKANKVGFAFPLQQDQFTVVRFSLDGVAKASQMAERLALEARKSQAEGTRNVTL
jgi:hypothetical protein